MSAELIFRDIRYALNERVKALDDRTYAIQDQLGIGGNGVVHECVDEADGSLYAIKFLTNHWEAARRERFLREQNLMATLAMGNHDHLIRFKTAGTVPTTYFNKSKKQCVVSLPFVVMEKARCSLKQLIKDQSVAIPAEVYMAQFRGLVNALAHLHKHAVHRDIKPANILVVGERWVISDFGLCSIMKVMTGRS